MSELRVVIRIQLSLGDFISLERTTIIPCNSTSIVS